jgi:surface polysaccharide O-acyltransferase-like enzyme
MLSAKQFSFATLYDGLVGALSSPVTVHLWYMYTMIVLAVIAPILRGGLKSLDRKGHILVFVICVVISLRTMIFIFAPGWLDRILNVDVITQLTFFNGHLATYLLGYYLGSLKKRIPNWILITGIVVLVGAITVGTYWKTVSTGAYDQTFQTQSRGFEVILAGFVFLFFKQNLNRKSKVLERIPVVPLSLAIYLMHNILLSMMFKVGLNVDGFLDVTAATLINFAFCFLVMKTVATIKPLCYLATGITFREACETCNWIYTARKIKAKRANCKE